MKHENFDLTQFFKARILVVGDLILDKYIHGDSSRLSPEAPVPVVLSAMEEYRMGGAANVALNAKSIGAEVDLLGVVGEDEEGKVLIERIIESGIAANIIQAPDSTTVTKLRILSQHQQLLRVDRECGFKNFDFDVLVSKYRKLLENIDCVIISDYGKGSISDARLLIDIARSSDIPVLVDPKGNDYDKYYGATALTPNLSEFALVGGDISSEKSMEDSAASLINRLALDFMLVTRSEDGMSLYSNKTETLHVPTQAIEVYDVTGAGDTVVAVMGVSIAAGFSWEISMRLANYAAGIVVGRIGTDSVSFHELKKIISPTSNEKIKCKGELVSLTNSLKANKKKIVMTNGCFDLLHPGHVDYLEKAKKLGDCLIVLLNSDESIKRLKGAGRPLNTLEDRAKMLGALNSVDYVVPFESDTPAEIYAAILPDVLVKGGDYSIENIVGRDQVENAGGKVVVLPFIEGYSSTNLIAKIRGNK